VEASDKRVQRLKVFALLIGITALLLIIRYGTVMLGGAESPRQYPSPEIERGPILDRRGRILAIQTRLDTVTAWKPDITDMESTVTILSDILELPRDELDNQFRTTNGFLTVQRTITPSQSDAIREEIRRGNLRGISLQEDFGRSYPERDAAAGVIGYVGVDDIGLAGIEYMFSGELLPAVAESSDLVMGNQVFLTLDLAIQSFADDLGKELLERYDADAVMIVVADTKDGDLLAMSSQPSFDANSYRSYPADQRRNRLISHVYEPGSVFKIFSLAGILDLGGITLSDTFNTTGGYRSQDGRFVITDLADYGRINAREIIKYSSNVGAAYASERVDAGSFYTMLRKFGFGDRTGIDLNGEERGLLSVPERWSNRTRQTIAIGQEIGVTAIQMVAAGLSLANNGILLHPQIVDRIVSPTGEVVRRFNREPVREALAPATASIMISLMESATEPGGTARRIQEEGIRIAAKTGTAEVFDREIGAYSDEHFIASTLAIFPADRPELLIYLVIDHPRGPEYLGGRIAAPAVDSLIEFLVPYWDIPRETDTVTRHPGRISVQEQTLPPVDDVVPDYTGLSARTLVPLLGRDDMTVRINGSGWVVSQDPPAGAPFSEGLILTLELE
jgi:cell division protein FtsI (penicillin-binding protein 3)